MLINANILTVLINKPLILKIEKELLNKLISLYHKLRCYNDLNLILITSLKNNLTIYPTQSNLSNSIKHIKQGSY